MYWFLPSIPQVAVPYLVVVTLYSILLMLALKMHKARYGSYKTAAASSTSSAPRRFSNLRLSFMSTTKSGKSTAKSSISSASSAHKATRKKTRKEEKEAYKATLPGLKEERKEVAKLIRYVSEDEADSKQSGKIGANGTREGTEKLMESTEAEQRGTRGRGEPGVVKHTVSVSSDSSVDALGDEREVAVIMKEKKEQYVGYHSRGDDGATLDVKANVASTEEDTHAHTHTYNEGDSEKVDICDRITSTDGGNPHTETGKQVAPNTNATGSTQDPTTPTDKGKEIQNGSGPTDSLKEHPQKSTTRPGKSTHDSDDDPPSLTSRTSRGDKHSSYTTTDDEEGTDEKQQQKSTTRPTEGRMGWFPSKYFNRVMTDTRDKVLFLKKCRAVKTVFLIIGSFTATYVPFVVGSMVYANEKEKRVCLLHMLNTLLYCVVVANSIANPFIYAYGYSEFRLKTKKFKGILAREKKRAV